MRLDLLNQHISFNSLFIMKLSTSAVATFKYFNIGKLCGRGGVQRFFMLSHDLSFQEELLTFDKWPEEKAKMIETGENPCGALPVTKFVAENGKTSTFDASQTIATCRLLARLHNIGSDSLLGDFVQDAVADEYQSFRNAWADVAFGDDQAAKDEYRVNKLPGFLAKFNALYKKYQQDDAFLSVSVKTNLPLWGDAAVFGVLYDHITSGLLSKEELKKYSKLSAAFEKFEAIPAVAKWINSA